jgi:phosphate transport system protein
MEQMFRCAAEMVKAALDCFVKMDISAAEKVLLMDDQVDGYKKKINRQSIDLMKSDTAHLEDHLDYILIARNLERLGDHATNIAEDVIFAFSGKDVRHGANY